MPLIPALEGRGRQISFETSLVYIEFQASQCYIVTPCLKTNNNNVKTGGEEEEWAGPRGTLLVSGQSGLGKEEPPEPYTEGHKGQNKLLLHAPSKTFVGQVPFPWAGRSAISEGICVLVQNPALWDRSSMESLPRGLALGMWSTHRKGPGVGRHRGTIFSE